jgi:radical SAM superfamily enzyme YgiQ (UPF0313 family)
MKVLFIVNTKVKTAPLGIMYLSGILKKHGHHTGVANWRYEKVRKTLIEKKFDMVAFSITSGNYYQCLEVCQKIKQEFNIFTIFGGPLATLFPEIIEEACIDGVCIGEGEEAIVEFVDKYQRGESIADIRNWWIKQNDRIYRNPVRPLITDLDALPFPDRKLLSHIHASGQRVHAIETTRDCPYNCTHCYQGAYSNIYKDKGIRKRSVDNVLRELEEIKDKFLVDSFFFIDDTFILDYEWIKEFTIKYRKEIHLPFFCYVRANLVTPNLVKQLKDGGCTTAGMGIESGDDYVRNFILRRKMTREEIITASRLIKAQGIRLITFNMVSIPGGSLVVDFATLELNIDCKPDYAHVAFFEPHPKLILTEQAIKEGLFDGNYKRFFDSSFDRKSMLNLKNKREVMEVENLHHLFSLSVKFPFILPFVRVLIKVPLGSLYFIIFKISRIFLLRVTSRDKKLSLKKYFKRFFHPQTWIKN